MLQPTPEKSAASQVFYKAWKFETENCSQVWLQYFFIRRVENLGVMRIHTEGFPQTLPSSSQKLCPNEF